MACAGFVILQQVASCCHQTDRHFCLPHSVWQHMCTQHSFFSGMRKWVLPLVCGNLKYYARFHHEKNLTYAMPSLKKGSCIHHTHLEHAWSSDPNWPRKTVSLCLREEELLCKLQVGAPHIGLVSRLIRDSILQLHGMPDLVLSGRGPHFNNLCWKEVNNKKHEEEAL